MSEASGWWGGGEPGVLPGAGAGLSVLWAGSKPRSDAEALPSRPWPQGNEGRIILQETPSSISANVGSALGFYLSLQLGYSWASLCIRGRFWGGGRYTSFLPPHPDEIEPQPVFKKKPLVWEEDMELYSKFLDRKVRRGCSLGSPFLPTHHPPHPPGS